MWKNKVNLSYPLPSLDEQRYLIPIPFGLFFQKKKKLFWHFVSVQQNAIPFQRYGRAVGTDAAQWVDHLYNKNPAESEKLIVYNQGFCFEKASLIMKVFALCQPR